MPRPSDPSASRWLQRSLLGLGMLWTLPNSALGLLLGAVGRSSARACAGSGASWRWPWGRCGALTLGNVIVHTGERLDVPCLTYAHRAGRCIEPPVSLADHERAHVCQYMLLGPLFLPLLCGGISVRNRFERAADRYARTGRGWWP